MDAKICTHCGKEFFKYTKSARNYFCSMECYGIWRHGKNNPNWRGGDIPHTCEFCGKEFFVRRDRATSQFGKYCSNECFYAFNASIRMPERQRRVSKNALKNLTGWLRRNTKIKLNWMSRFGYSPEDFKQHVESLWKSGMSWENYGSVWCLDHVTAMQFFDFTSIEDSDFRQCFALENLQPLFLEENTRKGRGDATKNIYWRR